MCSSYPAADRRRVFLASRSAFSGQNAHIRQNKAVRRVVQEHRNSFVALLKDFGKDKTTEIIKALLEDRIFESELKAKIEFPELFQISPARNVQHTESENVAARSEAEALEDFVSPEALDRCYDDSRIENPPEPPNIAGIKAPSLYPLSLPYSAQHIILTTVQSQLEECCFDFASKWLPKLLEDNRWDCAEAVELSKWIKTLPTLCENLPGETIKNDTGVSLQEIFSSTSTLRHSAVHRLPTSNNGVQRMLQSALRLTMTLGDLSKAAQVESLEAEIQCRVKDMQLNKNFLENRLDEQLQAICKQRDELGRMEEEAVATMLKEDKENRVLIGSLLESFVRNGCGVDDEGGISVRAKDHNLSQETDKDGGEDAVESGNGNFVAVEAEDAEEDMDFK